MNYQGPLKQSTQVTITILMVSTSDHIAGKTGLSAGLTIYASKAGAAGAAITPTVAELDSVNEPGIYSLILTTAHTNTLGDLQLHITGAGADPADYKWNISARLIDDLAFPATSGRSMVVDANGLVDANAVKIGPTGAGTAQTARDIGASVLLSTGTGTGQLDFTSGVVKANLAQILGTALTETAGQIAAAFKKFFNIGTPAATMDHLILLDTVTTYTGNTPQTGDNFARLGAPAGASISADIAEVEGETDAIIATLGAAGAGLTAIPTIATVTTLTNLPAIPANWLTAAGINAGALNGKGDWNIGKTGYALSAAGVQAIWDAFTSALTTVGSIGKLLVDNVNATISSRLATAGYTVPPTAAANATAVRTELTTELGRIDVAVSTRLATSGYTAPSNSDITAIKAKTDSLTFTVPGFADANIQAVNDVTVTGNGQVGTEWGP